jgi:seryl-tRNA synthetase
MTASTSKRLPTPAELENQLAHFINVTLLRGAAAVDRDTRLFEDGYMNSLRILDLIALVEKTLNRRVPDRAVRLANFRTIATIVQAFHPDAAPQPATTSPSLDRIFERRRDRARFVSPLDALKSRGDVTLTGAGQAALAGLALDVLEATDHTVLRWARTLGAAEHRYPSLIDLGVLKRAGQLDSFPQHLTRVSHSEPSGEESSSSRLRALYREPEDSSVAALPRNDMVALAPAVCYHAYPEWENKTLGPDTTLLTARGRCYRHEGGNYVPLERLWDFTMREIIILGTREQVEDVRHSLVRQVSELVTMLDLDASIDMATDPFFAAGDEGRRLMQQAGALKYELQLAVDATGRTIAAASFNHHHDFFGTRFGIRLADGTTAHSGCVAFGLERWVLALFAQHGVDHRTWSAGARSWLEDHHPTHGVSA